MIEIPKNPKFINRSGIRYGMLVVDYLHSKKDSAFYWKCKCDCSQESIVKGQNLISGNTTSCGCQEKRARDEWREKQKIKSPHSQKLQNMYDNMYKRCYVPTTRSFNSYGGRGITICDEWLNDRNKFYSWAIESGIEKNLTIERKDANGNYNPENCRFASCVEQANNKRNNRILTKDGISMTIAQWARVIGVSEFTLYRRREKGWSDEEIINVPINGGRNKK